MAEAIWAKNLPLDLQLHRFTVGADTVTDLQLMPFDVVGSAAHARMLGETGLLPEGEAKALVGALKVLLQEALDGKLEHPARGGGLPHRPGACPHRTAGRHRQAHPPGPLPQRPGDHRPAPAHARTGPGPGPGQSMPAPRRCWTWPGGRRPRPCPATPTCAGPCPAPGDCGPPPSPRGCWRTWSALPALWDRLDRCPLGAAAGLRPAGAPGPGPQRQPPGLLPGAAQPHGRHEQPGPARAGGGRLGGLGRRHSGKGPVGPGPLQH